MRFVGTDDDISVARVLLSPSRSRSNRSSDSFEGGGGRRNERTSAPTNKIQRRRAKGNATRDSMIINGTSICMEIPSRPRARS